MPPTPWQVSKTMLGTVEDANGEPVVIVAPGRLLQIGHITRIVNMVAASPTLLAACEASVEHLTDDEAMQAAIELARGDHG